MRSDNTLRKSSSVKTEEENNREVVEIIEQIEETDDIDWNAEDLCNGNDEKSSDIEYSASFKSEKSIVEMVGSGKIENVDWISDKATHKQQNKVDSDENELFLKSWDGGSTEYFYCLVCGAEFQDRDAVVGHTEKEHLGGPRGYKCYGCAKELETRWARELHEDLDCPNMPPGTKYRCR